ncbi:MAG: hypothetical protein JWQ71_3694 [Pedosphaera sp.]|nr:hypothetical protein [Pedosphaera sp.]
MNSSTPFLASFGDVVAKNLGISTSTLEILCILGSLIIVILGIVTWVVYFREKPRRRKHHHSYEKSEKVAGERTDDKEGGRRRRRRERTRNPTLAEKGGLPPLRTEAPPSEPSPLP